MKKNEYVAPEMEIVEVSTQGLVMASDTAGGEIGGLSLDDDAFQVVR